MLTDPASITFLQKGSSGKGKGKIDAVCCHLLFAARVAWQLCLFSPHSFVFFCFTALTEVSALISFSPFPFLALLLRPVTNSARARPWHPSWAVEMPLPLLSSMAAAAGPLSCPSAGSPRPVHLQGRAALSQFPGCSVPDHPAVSPSDCLLQACVHQARQRLGATLQVPQYFAGSQAPKSEGSVLVPVWLLCHVPPCATLMCLVGEPVLPGNGATDAQPGTHLPRYSHYPQLLSLGFQGLNCWRSFPFLSVKFPTKRQCVLKSWWLAETLPSNT